MSKVKHKQNHLTTVGEVIDALSKFPRDLPCQAGTDSEVTVYQLVPEKHESFEDDRGIVQIDGEDPWQD